MWSFSSRKSRLQALLPLIAVSISTTTVQGIQLLGGKINTSVADVQGILNLALDAADMRESDDNNRKLDIYKNVRTTADSSMRPSVDF